MRGTVQKKGTRWYAVVYDGVDPGTGRKRRRWIPAGTRRSDAERVLNEAIRRKYEGEPVPTERLTLGDYLVDRWLPIHDRWLPIQKSRVRPTTYDGYRRSIDLHVIPRLGRRPLDRLTIEDVDLLYATLLTEGRIRRSGPPGLSPKSVRNIHVMLNKALNDAVRKGLVVRNVVGLADAPSVGSGGRELRAWTAEQLVVFLDAVRSHRLHPAFHLAAYTGMRRGEILGLRWSDVDLAVGRLSVRQALVEVAYKVEVSDVKTSTGRRTIDLDAGTVDVLAAWRIERAEERGSRPPGEELVFTKADGTWIHPQTFSQILERKVAQLDVPRISLHDLRHTHATLMIKAGVPVKVVSERLGHANVAFTMSVYQHVLPGMQAEAANTFADLLRTPGDR